jgi:hypothetical protein
MLKLLNIYEGMHCSLLMSFVRAFFNRLQREASLQAYINEISELLIHENLGKSDEDAEVRKIARVRTLTVLRRLDGLRKGSVLQFLHESGLIDKGKRIIDLRGAHLGGANLDHADLRGADLRGAFLFEANLIFADLRGADLRGANLDNALQSHLLPHQ